ncbi:hypothetical protein [Geobacter sp. SVR]|uniref:nucleotide-binding protein n=1 Tax=Geobacter sp. SVR TaxID=2495594 RepID=UPI00143EFF43|nr:hypothetical protein [Geobacter sp. SVR]BCS53389.1 putative nitrogenase iron protein [Geobacter sp. SVR]GCF85485.1 nitrogenase iron protein [Geobacter sp. SVR]
MIRGGTRSIAIYGRNGVGKTVVSTNLSTALSLAGYRVLLIGCGSTAGSLMPSPADVPVPTLLGLMRRHPGVSPAEALWESYAGLFRLETGLSPEGGAGPDMSVTAATRRIAESGLFEELKLDYVIYNVQGDEAGGGFTVPVRQGFFQSIFTVMSAELNSVRATNSLFEQIRQHSGNGSARAGGIIANLVDAPFGRELIDDYASRTTIGVLAYIPRILAVGKKEAPERTVFESLSDSHQAELFSSLALKIVTNLETRIPHPLGPDELWRFSLGWNTRFVEMETGEGAGAGI